MEKEKKDLNNGRKVNPRRRSRIIFFSVMAALPVLQYCVFYIGVNMNSFIMSFQKYNYASSGQGYDVIFAGFDNFKAAWEILSKSGYMLKNSLIAFLVGMFIAYPLALLFSLYIYKKYFLHGFFKVLLFLPQIVSGLVFGLLFRYMTDSLYPALMMEWRQEPVLGLLLNPDTKFATTIFYNVWMGFGINVLMFSNAMGNIDDSVVEAAQLDGVNIIQEFFYITLPATWPTIISCVVISVTGLFSNQMGIYNLFGENGWEIATLGYWLYLKSTTSNFVAGVGEYSFSELAALGLLLTFILVPTVMLVKKALTKYGPSA